jgi:tetratricopeptide (TPR) repeat protein
MAVAVHTLTRAQLLIQIGNRQEATVLVHRALEIARESKDTNGQLQAFLLLARLEDPPECRAQADHIISHMHFERMRSVMAYNHSERLLHNGDHVAALEAITAFLAAPFETEEDADGARQCLIAAECFMTNQRSDEALPYVQHAQRQAADSGLMSESMMCGILMGRLAVERRDFECAFREFQRALKFAQTMSQSFTRDCDRTMFQQRRDVQYLTEEIKRLGLTLGQTERAGSTPARA